MLISRKLLFPLIFTYFFASSQDTSNVFLKAFDKIEKGDTSYFRALSHSKHAGSDFAFYLCKAKLYGSKNNRTAAFELYKKAIEVAGNGRDKAIANIKMGIYYVNNELLIPALQYFNKAELLYQFKETEPGYIELNKYIGIINSYIGSRQKSVDRFLKVFNAAKKIRDEKTMASSANNLGIGYIELKDYEEAEKFLSISLKIRENNRDELMMGQSYNNFGSLFFEKGDYKKALEYYNKGYILRQKFPAKYGAFTESQINIGKTLMKLGDMEGAEKMLSMAFNKGQEVNNLKFISLAAENLKELYYAKKNYKKAFDMQTYYQMATDSMYGYDKREEVNKLTIANEFKSKIVSDSLTLIKKEGELKIKESRNARNRLLSGALAVVLILVLFIVYMLFRQNKKEHAKNTLISKQADELREQHKEIKDSINYAQNLQQSLLPSNTILDAFLKEYFILYLPKDVVSGDFYWASVENINGGAQFNLALADCTGHGVPGAMVSVVGITSLTRCVKEFRLSSPAAILDKLSQLVSEAFSHNDKQLNDGMDISLCSITKENSSYLLKWAGANNPLWIIRNNILTEFKGTRRPVGAFINNLSFKEERMELQSGDLLYMITDGFGDQFGGDKGKKFKHGKLKDLIVSIHTLPLYKQKEKLKETFDQWKVNHEQIDDVSVIGFRI